MQKHEVYRIIHKFINDMGYLKDEHFLGVYFYGSYQGGYANEKSDIDLHIVFDDSDPEHLIRGNHFIDGKRVEYFEKPIGDLRQSVDNDFLNQNMVMLSITGNSEIIYERMGKLTELKYYTLKKFSEPLPPLNEAEAREYVSIINNRMERLETYAFNGDPQFFHLYHLTVEKIRKFHHRAIGSSKISTCKVYRVYADNKYAKLICNGKLPSKTFRYMYLDAIVDQSTDMYVKFKKLQDLYDYVKKDISIDENSNYRIPIRSRNDGLRRF